MTRKICVITGTRAEYGLLRRVMQEIKDDESLALQLIVTGMHLSPEFGQTYKEIENDDFVIDKKVEMLVSSDTPTGISKSIGLGIIGIADALQELKPEIVILLGDRFEIFASACAALVACIPVAHLHGGEVTEGAIDDAFRHSITKMSHIHFVGTEEYRKRVVQLGEHPDSVFNVGGFGLDSINNLELVSKEEIEKSLDFRFLEKNLLITFHPETLEKASTAFHFQELLDALSTLENVGLIFTFPNSDTGSRSLIQKLEYFAANNNVYIFKSLGQLDYFSLLTQVDGVVGNSSSGLLEVPSFKKGTINIGDRQKGRLQATSIINCQPDKNAIIKALNTLFSQKYQESVNTTINPYGTPGASSRTVSILKSLDLDNLVKKSFFNLDVNI